jgi:hypothetical protein
MVPVCVLPQSGQVTKRSRWRSCGWKVECAVFGAFYRIRSAGLIGRLDWDDGSLKDRDSCYAGWKPDRIDRWEERGRSKMMLKFACVTLVIMAVALAATHGARAQNSSPPPAVTSEGAPASDLPLADYQAFDQFAIAHPEIISTLGHRPQLIEDQAYLAKHPELRDFLSSHAELRDALIKDPGDFIEPHSGRSPL